MVFNGFDGFLMVFDGFSIVFNGLSLHEVNTQGSNVSVIGEVFLFIRLLFYYYYYYFIFFCVFHNQLLVHLGYWGFASYPNSGGRNMHPELCGDVTDMVVGASWNLEAGQRIINAWVFNP